MPDKASALPPPAVTMNALLSEVDGWLECLQSAHRMEARIAAFKAGFAALLASSAVFAHSDRNGAINSATEEISMALGVSRMMANRLVKVGVVTGGMLRATGEAFEAGVISLDKAWVLVDCLGDVVAPVAWAVEERVLPSAATRTPTELRRDIARALVELDPDNADTRHEAAARQRRVTRPQVLPDGMARMGVVLPADQAVALDCALDFVASAALSAGDQRTCTQVRADALAEWGRRTLQEGWEFTTANGTEVRSAPAQINVTIPLEVLARAVPGWTPLTSVAKVVAVEEGFLPAEGATADGSGGASEGASGGATEGGSACGSEGGPGETIPDGPLRGHRTEAAWLEGYGPITPAIALLLAAGGSWRRIVTDTLTGAPLDIGRTRYAPPAAIALAVRLRDRTCTRPTCSVPARRCEQDHVHDWALGGGTSVDELVCLCGRCHRVKTLQAGRPGPRKPDGTRDWISATGRTYVTHPERTPRLHGGCLLGRSHAAADDDDPPPF